MKNFSFQELTDQVTAILHGEGMPETDAHYVASLLVKADLCGHSTHGVAVLLWYLQILRGKEANLQPHIRVVKETPTMAMVDGDLGFGQIVLRKTMQIALEKAKGNSVTLVTFKNSLHVGRLGDFAEIGARQGFITVMWANLTNPAIAPHGGREARLGTNPMCVAVPGREGPAFCFDVASSTATLQALRHHINQGKSVPPDWIIDADGNPTCDPQVMYQSPRGSLLPFGAHRGYGQALVAEVLGGILSGGMTAKATQRPVLNGGTIILIKVDDFFPLVDFLTKVEDLGAIMRSTPPAPGFGEVRLPGDSSKVWNQVSAHSEVRVSQEIWTQIERLRKESERE